MATSNRDDRTQLDRAERIVLSKRDTMRVLKRLKNPPRPTPALLAAVRRRELATYPRADR
jgi:uncharacterized protein (DUF1778 family)